ncbi:MAG: hypothetical protein HKM05_06875 [Spirochaetales bacterium]|nr:hypothetical protein [Spirochaetales bacterium]
MQVYDVQQLQAKFADRQVKVDPYFLRHTRLLTNQTLLKLGEYNLTVVPGILSLQGAQLLGVLTAPEVSLFSRFIASVSTLVLVFDNPDKKDTARFHIKVHLQAITPLPDRKNVCWLVVSFTTAPAELVQILGQYWEEQELRLEAYEKWDTMIVLDDAQSGILGYNHYAELLQGERRWKVTLKTLSAKLAEFVLPETQQAPDEAKDFQLKVYFRSGAVTVAGKITTKGTLALEFSNELLSTLEDYLFRKTVLAKKKAAEAGNPS